MRDARYLLDKDYNVIYESLLVVSNIFVIPAILIAIRSKEWSVVFVLLNVFWISSIYHLCDSFEMCILSFHTLFWLDHFFAFMAFVVLTIFGMNFCNPEHKYIILLIMGQITFFTYIVFGITLYTMGALVVILCILFTLRWIYGGVPHFKLADTFISSILLALGLVLFIIFNDRKNSYWWIHSLWHCFILLSAYFVLEIKKPPLPPCHHVTCQRCNQCHHCARGKCSKCRNTPHEILHSHVGCGQCNQIYHGSRAFTVKHPIQPSNQNYTIDIL